MKNNYLIVIGLLFLVLPLNAQYRIGGQVTDAETGNPLPGAHVFTTDYSLVTTANNEGVYQLQLEAGDSVQLSCSYVGYETLDTTISLQSKLRLNIELKAAVLQAVVVDAGRLGQESGELEVTRLTPQAIAKIPMLMGEKDVIKALTMFPGVGGTIEGKAEMQVRGGTHDQNLILFDDVPVYSSGNLFGFFSLFNPTAVGSVRLLKGKFPAAYGSRLSSVVDIVGKEGSKEHVNWEYSFGLINSQLNINGPLTDKLTFSASARAGNLGLILLPNRLLYEAGSSDLYGNFSFYDTNLKLAYQLKPGHKLTFSSLTGGSRGQFNERVGADIESRTRYDWKTKLLTLKYSGQIKPNWFMKANVFHTDYKNTEGYIYDALDEGQTNLSDESVLRETGLRFDNELLLGRGFRWKTGLYASVFRNISDKIKYSTDLNEDVNFSLPGQSFDIRQGALYSDFILERGRHRLEAGLRWSNYRGDQLRSSFLEPRLYYQLKSSDKLTLSASYARLSQPMHLLTGLSDDLPTINWIVSHEELPVAYADNFSVGGISQLNDRGWSLEYGLYYRRMRELSDFPLGAQLYFDPRASVLDKLERHGQGRAYGMELLLRKSTGKTQGWISATIGNSERRFASINKANWYPTQYRQLVDIKFFVNHQFSKKKNLSLTAVWGSGQPVTFPEGFALNHPDFYNYNVVPVYRNKHNGKTPNYFRLDVQYTKYYTTKRGAEGWISLGVYNTSFHRNTTTIEVKDIRTDDSSSQNTTIKGVKSRLSLFNAVPYITIGRRF